MARADLLISLVKAGIGGDRNAVRSAAETIIADEKGKQHNILADRLSRALQINGNGNGNGGHMPAHVFHQQNNKGRDALSEVTARHRLADLVIDDQTRKNINHLIEEQGRGGLLRAHGIDPRHRIMLVGPPGNGKTSLAGAIAEELAVPLYVIRYESLIGSYLGETALRLKHMFDYIRTTPCVVFFDEFDTVGKERGDAHETGEIKRVVSSLLMHIDELPSYTIIIAASNHAELLDRAVWRRFQLRISLPAPTASELTEYLKRHFTKFNDDPGISASSLATKLGKVSYAEAEEFILDIRRREILSTPSKILKAIMSDCLRAWKVRAKPIRINPNNE